VQATALQVQSLVQRGAMAPRAGYRALEKWRFRWRGDGREQVLLQAMYTVALRGGMQREALAAAATLIRNYDLGPQGPAVVAGLRGLVAGILGDRTSKVATSAGLFWRYRDLIAQGDEGDRMARTLASRLASAGLFAKAGDILGYQARSRVEPFARGTLGAQAATWYLAAGLPEPAIAALATTQTADLPADVQLSRRRLEIAAAIAAGKNSAAMALLDDAAALGTRFLAEAWWRVGRMDMAARFGDDLMAQMRSRGSFDGYAVLRQATALVSVGRIDDAAALSAAYAAADPGSRAARLLRVLVAEPERISVADLGSAMAGFPAPARSDAMLRLAVGCDAIAMSAVCAVI
jgi:hypothetical protein